jgi:hypothetical protein
LKLNERLVRERKLDRRSEPTQGFSLTAALARKCGEIADDRWLERQTLVSQV